MATAPTGTSFSTADDAARVDRPAVGEAADTHIYVTPNPSGPASTYIPPNNLPRYGAASIAGEAPAPTTIETTHHSINWGGVLKGVAIVSAVALVCVGGYMGATWLAQTAFGTTTATAIGSASNTVINAATPVFSSIGHFITTTAPDYLLNVAWPATQKFAVETALPNIGSAFATVFEWIGKGLTAIHIPVGAAATGNALPAATAAIGALGAGAGLAVAAAHAAGPLSHISLLDTHTTTTTVGGHDAILDHTAQHMVHRASEHTAERHHASVERATAANRAWAERMADTSRSSASSVTPRGESFAESLNNDRAQLDAALAK